MFPHNFVVKEIEFWSGYNWGTIKLETSQARNVLLEHAKYHPFKPFTDGKSNSTKFSLCLRFRCNLMSFLHLKHNTVLGV